MSCSVFDLAPINRCRASAKDGSICHQILDVGSSQWCPYHCKKLIKYYKTYKGLEVSIDYLNNDKPIDSYSKEELLEMNSKLIKVYHYRVVLRDQGYPDYQDQGHQQRIELILDMIKKLSERIIILNNEFIEQMNETIITQQRKAVATSTKQHKQKKQKCQHARLTSVNLSQDKYSAVMSANILCNHMVKKYLLFLMKVIDKYFVDKFGRSKGYILMQTSLACAFGIYKMLYGIDKIATKNEQFIAINNTPELDTTNLKSHTSTTCSFSSFISMLNTALGYKYSQHDQTFDIKFTMYFYILFIVIDSYRIDIDDALQKVDFDFKVNKIAHEHYDDPMYLRINHFNTFLDDFKNGIPKGFEPFIKDRTKLLAIQSKRKHKPYPQLDIAFCMKASWLFGINDFRFYHTIDNKCVFTSPFINSNIVNLAAVKDIADCYHICYVDEHSTFDYLSSIYGECFDIDVAEALNTNLLYLSPSLAIRFCDHNPEYISPL